MEYVVSSEDLIQYIYQQDTQEAIDKMAADVEAQKAKRDKFSRYIATNNPMLPSSTKSVNCRRRRHNPDNDIDYINERNMKFNQKCERFYGEYTKVCFLCPVWFCQRHNYSAVSPKLKTLLQDIKDNLERGTAVWEFSWFPWKYWESVLCQCSIPFVYS